MFNYKLVRKKTLDDYKELKTEHARLQAELVRLKETLNLKVESAVRNHDKVVENCKTESARYALFRALINSMKFYELNTCKSFIQSKQKSLKDSQEKKNTGK